MIWNIEHYRTVRDMTRKLPAKPFNQFYGGRWYRCNGVTIHHTWKPTMEMWRGFNSMQNLGKYYQGLGWPSGPHLFIAVGSKNPAHDGIWRGTPLDHFGVHAKSGNYSTIGIEVVGNYDVVPWTPQMESVVIETTVALLNWMGSREDKVYGHREWTHDKSCPGRAIDMDSFRNKIAAKLNSVHN